MITEIYLCIGSINAYIGVRALQRSLTKEQLKMGGHIGYIRFIFHCIMMWPETLLLVLLKKRKYKGDR